MTRYEAHLTFALKDADKVEAIGVILHTWKFSKIHGCPLMGPDAKYAYLTGYNSSGKELKSEMEIMVETCEARGVTPLRQKIERIVYDTQTGVNEIC